MKVKLDYPKTFALRKKLWNKLKENILTQRKQIHRTDLIHCLLKTYFRTQGVTAYPKPSVVETYIVRTLLHRVMQEHFRLSEVEYIWNHIPGHIDLVWQKYPTEIKTSIQPILNANQAELYAEDILSASLFTGQDTIFLIVLNLSIPEFIVFRVNVTEKERQKFSEILTERYRLLVKAFQEKEPKHLPNKLNECSSCEYLKSCNETFTGGRVE